MFKSEEISKLQARVSQLEKDLQAANDGGAAIQARIDQANADLAAAQSLVAAHQETITGLTAKVTTAETAQKSAEDRANAAEASINDQVTQRLAAAGVAPIAKDPKAADPGEKTEAKTTGSPLSRAASAMSGFKVFKK